MDDQNRLELILAQARIAKAALTEHVSTYHGDFGKQAEQAVLALEAVILLADSDFHNKSDAA